MTVRVLIIEDNPDLARDRERYLRGISPEKQRLWGITGFEFAYAGCGAEAEALLNKAAEAGVPYHVALLDLHLPYYQAEPFLSVDVGLALLRLATRKRAAMRILVVSGFPDEMLQTFRDGVHDFMEKPLDENNFRDRFLLALSNLIQNEDDNARAERLRRLLPHAQLAWARHTGRFVSGLLSQIASLPAGTQEPRQPLTVKIIDQAKRSWEDLISDLLPASTFEKFPIARILTSAAEALEPCFTLAESGLSIASAGDIDVRGYSEDLALVVRELLLGPILSPASRCHPVHVALSVLCQDAMARVIVQDDAAPLEASAVDAINQDSPIAPDEQFGRAWGLSIMQQTAIRGGGHIEVSVLDEGNQVILHLPWAAHEEEHALSLNRRTK